MRRGWYPVVVPGPGLSVLPLLDRAKVGRAASGNANIDFSPPTFYPWGRVQRSSLESATCRLPAAPYASAQTGWRPHGGSKMFRRK
jgi:hypothetical protein